LPLERLPGLSTAPAGFDVRYLVDGLRYSLALEDTQDVCRPAVFSDQSGRIHVGFPVSAALRTPF
jgi:hypothetical protein